MLAIFLAIHLVAEEYFPSQQSKGEIIVFRKGREQRISKTNDEEADPVNSYVHSMIVENAPLGSNNSETRGKGVTGIEENSTFYWSNIHYSIKTKTGTRNILTNVKGWLKPGTLTALMVGTICFHNSIIFQTNVYDRV
jgi:ATP-binding cassette subfamily G (WHITE) protein 2 (PDR)